MVNALVESSAGKDRSNAKDCVGHGHADADGGGSEEGDSWKVVQKAEEDD